LAGKGLPILAKVNTREKIAEVSKVSHGTVDKVKFIRDNQLGRRNIPDYARVELNLRKEDILRPIAKEKQVEAGKLKQKSAKAPINIRDTIAKASKVSHDTVARVKFIRDNADEETKSKLRRGSKG
jgi:hypothetical protein